MITAFAINVGDIAVWWKLFKTVEVEGIIDQRLEQTETDNLQKDILNKQLSIKMASALGEFLAEGYSMPMVMRAETTRDYPSDTSGQPFTRFRRTVGIFIPYDEYNKKWGVGICL